MNSPIDLIGVQPKPRLRKALAVVIEVKTDWLRSALRMDAALAGKLSELKRAFEWVILARRM